MPSHLAARDVAFVACSSASPKKLDAYKKKLGWTFRWLSASDNFQKDCKVSFSEEEAADPQCKNYNHGTAHWSSTEAPGVSVFTKRDDKVYLTYSTFARGLDVFMTAYHFLDCVPKGRDESTFDDKPMTWIQRRTDYSDYVQDNWWSFLLPYGESF